MINFQDTDAVKTFQMNTRWPGKISRFLHLLDSESMVYLQVTQQGLKGRCVLYITRTRAQIHWTGEIENQLKGPVADQTALRLEQESEQLQVDKDRTYSESKMENRESLYGLCRDTAVGHTLYPFMRFISCCMAELVSRTETRTLTAAYREPSSSAIATRLRATAGPPMYRNPVDAFLGVKVRMPRTKTTVANRTAEQNKKKFLSSVIYRNVRPRLLLLCGLYHSGAGWCFWWEAQEWSDPEMLFSSVKTHTYKDWYRTS